MTDEERIKKHREYSNAWCKNNKEKRNATAKKRREANGWYIYYIPSIHYCGITNDLPSRRAWHKCKDIDVEGFRVLYHSMDKSEAAYHESMFQGVLGIHGVNVKGVK